MPCPLLRKPLYHAKVVLESIHVRDPRHVTHLVGEGLGRVSSRLLVMVETNMDGFSMMWLKQPMDVLTIKQFAQDKLYAG